MSQTTSNFQEPAGGTESEGVAEPGDNLRELKGRQESMWWGEWQGQEIEDGTRATHIVSPMQIQKSLLSQSRREQSRGTLGKSSATETITLSWEERVMEAGLKGK